MKKVLLAAVAILGFAATADAGSQQFVVVNDDGCNTAVVQRVVVPQQQLVVVSQPQRVVVSQPQQVVVNNGGAQKVVVNQGRLLQRNQKVVVQNGVQRIVVK